MMNFLKHKYHFILRDNRTRSILKAVSYRVTSLFITFLISLIITNNLKVAFTIGGFDFFAKTIYYYLHERLWHYSKIGRIKEK